MDNLQAAIDVVNAANAEPGGSTDAPATETTTTEAPATPAATEAAPKTEAAPAVDETADLMAKLEARKAERVAKKQQGGSEVAELRAQLAALESKLSQAPAPTQDFAALVREHGHVEAVRRMGFDPLEFFDGFKNHARDPAAIKRQAEARAEAERLAKLEEKVEGIGKTREQQIAEAQVEADRQAWRNYVGMVDKAETGTPLLAKLPPEERIEETQRAISWLQRNDYDLDAIDDLGLAKITEQRLRKRQDLLAGTDASANATRTPAATDGAPKTTSPNTSATTLSNDLASQSTGRTVPMTEAQRLRAAIEVMEKMSAE